MRLFLYFCLQSLAWISLDVFIIVVLTTSIFKNVLFNQHSADLAVLPDGLYPVQTVAAS